MISLSYTEKEMLLIQGESVNSFRRNYQFFLRIIGNKLHYIFRVNRL